MRTVWVTSGAEDSILAGTERDFAGGLTGRIGGAADFFGPFFFTADGFGLDAAGALAFLASDCTGCGFDSTGLDIGDGGGFPLFW